MDKFRNYFSAYFFFNIIFFFLGIYTKTNDTKISILATLFYISGTSFLAALHQDVSFVYFFMIPALFYLIEKYHIDKSIHFLIILSLLIIFFFPILFLNIAMTISLLFLLVIHSIYLRSINNTKLYLFYLPRSHGLIIIYFLFTFHFIFLYFYSSDYETW